MKGPAGSSTAQGPEQSLRIGLLWPRGGGQTEIVTSGQHGMARLTATLGAQASLIPQPWASCLGNTQTQVSASTYYILKTGFLIVQKRHYLWSTWLVPGYSCSKCCHTDSLNSRP